LYIFLLPDKQFNIEEYGGTFDMIKNDIMRQPLDKRYMYFT